METISKLARRFGLSRSTLLHYDRVGLLQASERSKSGYRLYTSEDTSRLKRICEFRKAGLGLRVIATLLEADEGPVGQALEQRLNEINQDINRLQGQQEFILGLLQNPKTFEHTHAMTKDKWVSLLKASGFTEQDMRDWHTQFERTAPKSHQQFLEFLRLPPREIKAIRHRATKRIIK